METFTVDVGAPVPLTVARFGASLDGDAPVVLAAHGITATKQVWAVLAGRLGTTVCLVAPDLRGRGESRDVGPPYGIATHVSDLVAVLDHLGIERTTLVGHSMGAWVMSVLAARHPERARAVLLVDGAVPRPVIPSDQVDAYITAVLGPALARLSMTFPDASAYHDFWRAHPAFGPDNRVDDADLVAYADADLVGDPPTLRSSVQPEAVRADGADIVTEPSVTGAAGHLSCRVVLLRAQRGLLNDDNPLLVADDTRAFAAAHDNVELVEVDDVNHYSILFAPDGVAAVAAALGSLT
jgi:pimeloyl-ACP methyl ester carboxylesterase